MSFNFVFVLNRFLQLMIRLTRTQSYKQDVVWQLNFITVIRKKLLKKYKMIFSFLECRTNRINSIVDKAPPSAFKRTNILWYTVTAVYL